ncbi:hypothetical protein [Sphingomicrobium arenosum]|uniref:hypothetical protein n=1 Tax=Sphingomicrobium arenosum TaxID=2233861 RepID=UPI002240BC44|nr:hypothetical protein [Sphingomicrobium arenosum]
MANSNDRAPRWSARRRAQFLEELAVCGNVGQAAAACGLSSDALYRRRHREPDFARDWDGALAAAMERLPHRLMEAAQAQFDPDAAGLRDQFPKVTTREALEISKILAARIAGAATGDADRAPPNREDVEAARKAVAERLDRLAEEMREEMLAQGWNEADGVLIPPGWGRIGKPGEAG